MQKISSFSLRENSNSMNKSGYCFVFLLVLCIEPAVAYDPLPLFNTIFYSYYLACAVSVFIAFMCRRGIRSRRSLLIVTSGIFASILPSYPDGGGLLPPLAVTFLSVDSAEVALSLIIFIIMFGALYLIFKKL